MGTAGGIDVGGTKIEAKLFSDSWADLGGRRIPTPLDTYENLLDAIALQVRWLEDQSPGEDIPIGIGIPGLVDQITGRAVIANLPANGRNLRDDLSQKAGRQIWFENDCRAFTLSEARLGAGRGFNTVLGLIMGTGVAAGFSTGGKLLGGRNGVAGELGHLPIPAVLAKRHDLPVLACGCGRTGCYETLVSGPGLAQLAKLKSGEVITPRDIAELALQGDPVYSQVMDIWAELSSSLIQSAMLVVDPDCIVLGGGLSNIPDIDQRLRDALPSGLLKGMTPPQILLAEGGDSSGTRGAALAASDSLSEKSDG